ncbi:MAG TPA: acyltransferase [Verrucomicrobiae bacterium]|nr:acyltransferase [Verrucomicrobiae bacterium]
MQLPSRRIPSLDGLRAISIFMVVFVHSTDTINFPKWLIKKPLTFIIGILGVRVFFVISGFLITTLLLRERERNGTISLSGFYKRRALRILPVYCFYLLTVLVVIGWLGLNAIHPSAYLSALTFTTRLWGTWGNESWPLMHTWSLSIEEQFYLIWPVMLVFLGPAIGGRIWIPTLILIAPILRFCFWDNYAIDRIFPTQGDSIAFGCLLAFSFAYREKATHRFFEFHPHLGRVAAVIIIYLRPLVVISLEKLHHPMPELERFFVTFVPTFQCASIAYLIGSYVTVRRGLSYVFLNLEFVQWIGRLSYSLYMWQELVLLQKEMQVIPTSWTFGTWLGSFPQNVIAAFALATCSYYFLEQPFLKLKGRLAKVPTATEV